MNLGSVSETCLIKLSSRHQETTAVTLILQPSQKQRRRRVEMGMKSLSSFTAPVTRRKMMVEICLQFPPPLQWSQSSLTGSVTQHCWSKSHLFYFDFWGKFMWNILFICSAETISTSRTLRGSPASISRAGGRTKEDDFIMPTSWTTLQTNW